MWHYDRIALTDQQRSDAAPFNVGMIEIPILGHSNRPDLDAASFRIERSLIRRDPEVGANRTHVGMQIGTASALDMFVGPKLCEP